MFHVQRTSIRNVEIEDPVRNCSPLLRSALPFSFSQAYAGQAADEFGLETPTYFQVPTGDLGRMASHATHRQRPWIAGIKPQSALCAVFRRHTNELNINNLLPRPTHLSRIPTILFEIFPRYNGRCQNTTQCILPTLPPPGPPDSGWCNRQRRQ